MKKLILTAILAAILPAYLASAADQNGNGNPPDGKPKQHQDGPGGHGKCNKNGNGKKGKPGPDGPQNNQ